MSLLGIDVGTTGCKAAVFSEAGTLLAMAYREYNIQRPQPGHAELDSIAVWRDIKQVIAEAASTVSSTDPIAAVCASSLGEAVVPVTKDRKILASSLLNADARGAVYLPDLAASIAPERLYEINGNTLGNHYTLTKLMWLRDQQPALYKQTDFFLHWGAFVSFMMGGEPTVDYCLANRTLLFDIDQKTWSPELLQWAHLAIEKLPPTVPSGTVTGHVSPAMAAELNLPAHIPIVAGAHDQCANAVGCGAVEDGVALFGMGTFFCIAPTFSRRPQPPAMIKHGLNTEHHAAPDRYVCFIYNDGGSLLKWYRNTFAAAEHQQALQSQQDIYPALLQEITSTPSSVLVLPHFSPTGPPEFIADSSGVMIGLKLETTRGEILRGIMEGTIFYLRNCLERLPETGIPMKELRAVGGGSHSDAWLQLAADILGHPLTRAKVPEAGALGSAILAGTATGRFATPAEGASAMVRLGKTFDPVPETQRVYHEKYAQYQQMWPGLQGVTKR